MKKIEQGLEQCFTEVEEDDDDVENEVDKLSSDLNNQTLTEEEIEIQSNNQENKKEKPNLQPFCKVNQVQFGSPAEIAGLKTGDLICTFGYANHTNHNNLKLIRDVVIANEDNEIDVFVIRNSNTVELKLTPKKWSGNGLLG